MIYIVGGRGFAGSAYGRLFDVLGLAYKVVTRDSIQTLRGTSCDVLINANGNSKKLLAASKPLRDFDLSVRSVAETVEAFSIGTYVLLSSGDVYPDQSRPGATREQQVIDPAQQSRYGLHKHLAEKIVRGTQARWLIMRMSGMVGAGLKKNAIFDMMTSAPVWLSPESQLQFISTDKAAEIVWGLIKAGVTGEIVNLGARGVVNLGALHRRIGSKSRFVAEAPTVRYELSLEKLGSISPKPLPEANAEVDAFLTAKGVKFDTAAK
ncbi:MAG: NAD-dependent epimerase/dehydratase family protein [Pseudolabrys sp.]